MELNKYIVIILKYPILLSLDMVYWSSTFVFLLINILILLSFLRQWPLSRFVVFYLSAFCIENFFLLLIKWFNENNVKL